MNVIEVASFADGDAGGNPAGIVLSDRLPSARQMQDCAREVGYSETAFAALGDDGKSWRVRYFSPESEVPFCGHATIALGAVLAETRGAGTYALQLNNADITVEGWLEDDRYVAALQSPPTNSELLTDNETAATLSLFGLRHTALDESIAPARIHGGADHYLIALKRREDLGAMRYDLDEGREFMQQRGIITIMLVHRRSHAEFDVRNAFASGGVFEDPATGAAAAAFAGYLRDRRWTNCGRFDLVQGEDMGSRSIIVAEFNPARGSSVRISGATRKI